MPVKCLLIVLSSNSSVAVAEDITKDTLQAATLFKQSLRTITCIAGHSSTNSGKKVSNCLKTGHSNRLSADSTDSFLKFFSNVFLSHRRILSGVFQPLFNTIGHTFCQQKHCCADKISTAGCRRSTAGSHHSIVESCLPGSGSFLWA